MREEQRTHLDRRILNSPAPPSGSPDQLSGPIDVSDGEVIASLELTGCYLDSVPSFSGASCREVRLAGWRLPGFNGRLVQVRGSPRFSSPGGDAITGDNLTVPDHADLSRTVHAGTLSLRGARFGSLTLEGATLDNPGGYALHAEHLDISTYLDGTGGLTADGIGWPTCRTSPAERSGPDPSR